MRSRLAIVVAVCCAAGSLSIKVACSQDAFQTSYLAGSRDAAGRFMGGTEIRVFAAHDGRLYAGNGYWEDRPGAEGWQGAQILVLDAPDASWRVDHAFDERLPAGRARNLAISALTEVSFSTDFSGARLAKSVSLLIASTWDLTGATSVFSRIDETGVWIATTLSQDRAQPDFLPQVRSFGAHRDRETGIDYVFAGQDPRGIFRGNYDASLPGRIRWSDAPELDISRIPTAAFPGLAGRLRVSSFAECNGRLYAAVGQQIYERVDGAAPRWQLVYTNPHPFHSETGLRGLTALAKPDGGQVLLAAIEGANSRIVRIDPRDGSETTDLDLGGFLSNAWRTRVGYVIAAYNDMTTLHDARLGDLLLVGLEAFIPPRLPVPEGHRTVDVGRGRLEAGAWYLVRHPDGHYDLREIAVSEAHKPWVATRAIQTSPFPNDSTVYFGGYDANKSPAHDTAWIARSAAAAALGKLQPKDPLKGDSR